MTIKNRSFTRFFFKKQVASCGLAILMAVSARGATISSDWNQFTTGTYSWDVAANWTSQTWVGSPTSDWGTATTPGSVPNNGTNMYAARIMNATSGDITVATSGGVTLGRLWLQRDSTGSVTLKLGGNMLINGTLTGPPVSSSDPRSRPIGFRNNVASTPGAMVLDLNSYSYSVTATTAEMQNARNYTIRDTSVAGNGTFSLKNINRNSAYIEGRVNVENNVTVQVTDFGIVDLRSSSGSTTDGWNFSSTASLALNGGTTGGAAVALWVGGTFGNVTVGSTNNDIATVYAPSGNDMRIYGNVNYQIAKNGDGAYLSMLATNRRIYVGGNFTDKATTGGDYGGTSSGGITFNGGIASEKQIWIARSGLSTVFQIGESASIAGNVALAHDLTTTTAGAGTGRIVVQAGSRLNLATYKLEASRVDIFNSAGVGGTVAYTFGDDSNAVIKANSLLVLNQFNIELHYDGSGWVNGDDLLLFHYGTLSGTPTLQNVFADSGITYGSLFNDGAGNIWLKDITVTVPEPSTIACFIGGLVLLTAFRRRSGMRS